MVGSRVLLAAFYMVVLVASSGSAQVLDDDGRPITEEEIDQYTDAGVSGGVIGGILGFAAGMGVTIAFVDLESGNSTAYVAPIALGTIGAFMGARFARVNRQEAIERIKEKRKAAANAR
jgi:hypothetical protein